MPPIVIAGAIAAAGTIASAKMSSDAQKNASDKQAQGANAALDFTKQQEADKKAMYDQAVDAWKQQNEAMGARRDALLSSYGFSMPQASAAPGVSASATPGLTPTTPESQVAMTQPGGVSLSSLLQSNPDDVWKWSSNTNGNKYGLSA